MNLASFLWSFLGSPGVGVCCSLGSWGADSCAVALELMVCVRCIFTQFQTIINTAQFEFKALVVPQGVCLAASGAHWIKELCHTPGIPGARRLAGVPGLWGPSPWRGCVPAHDGLWGAGAG